MTAIMGLAFAYFLVAQNRWSWHLIGHRHGELEVGGAGLGACLPACPAASLPGCLAAWLAGCLAGWI
jgi:hypothetical protein